MNFLYKSKFQDPDQKIINIYIYIYIMIYYNQDKIKFQYFNDFFDHW